MSVCFGLLCGARRDARWSPVAARAPEINRAHPLLPFPQKKKKKGRNVSQNVLRMGDHVESYPGDWASCSFVVCILPYFGKGL